MAAIGIFRSACSSCRAWAMRWSALLSRQRGPYAADLRSAFLRRGCRAGCDGGVAGSRADAGGVAMAGLNLAIAVPVWFAWRTRGKCA
jgi:hypothetical protein